MIDFFDDKCKTESSKKEFGICDEGEQNPAYIDESNSEKWIAIVKNSTKKNIEFYAIDNCITMKREDGKDSKQCDGLLKDENTIIFVELKSRTTSKWFNEGKRQIIQTFNFFKQNYDISDFSFKAYICNKKRPRANQSRVESIQRFRDEIGFIVYDKQLIEI